MNGLVPADHIAHLVDSTLSTELGYMHQTLALPLSDSVQSDKASKLHNASHLAFVNLQHEIQGWIET